MKRIVSIVLSLIMLLPASIVLANDYVPSKDMTIRVPFAAGGSADTMARIIAQGLQQKYGKTVFVTNLTGANGAIAAADLASVAPDATEMMVGGITMFTLTPLFNPEVALKMEDYQIICGLNSEVNLLYVNTAATGIKDWEGLVEYAKDNRITFGSGAPGITTHMLGTMLFGEAGITAEAVTADGSMKNLLALAGGNVVCTIAPSSVGAQYVEEGTLTPILVMDNAPYTGYEGFEVPSSVSKGYDIVFKTMNFIMTRKDAKEEEIAAIYDAILAYGETEEFQRLAATANWIPVLVNGETAEANIDAAAKMCADAYDKYYK